MIAALHRWLERDVQPLARKHLGAPVVRIETMSSYSCRNAYGRTGSRLSEHGKANALDIGAFVTARGETAMVRRRLGSDRPPDRRPGSRRQGRGRESPSRRQSARQRSRPRPRPPQPIPPSCALARRSAFPASPCWSRVCRRIESPSLGLAPPSRLGGPKPPAAAHPSGKMDFLRAAHRSACTLFNTVLGPEANNAHQNHFHVDMAERIKNTKICE